MPNVMSCNICRHDTEIDDNQDSALICKFCESDISGSGNEIRKIFMVVDKAADIDADLVSIYVTSERIIFIGTNLSDSSDERTPSLRGFIGDVVDSAFSDKRVGFVSIQRSEIASLSEEACGLFKSKRRLTVLMRTGSSYDMIVSKREAEKIKNEVGHFFG